jgi:hypothetical protein
MSDTYLPASAVRARYKICDVTLYRWMRNPNVKFPAPALRPNSRSRFWRLTEIEQWEADRAEGGDHETVAA